MTRIVGLIASLLLIAGCGEAGAQDANIDMTSARAIADWLDGAGFTCKHFRLNTEVPGARQRGTCAHGKTTVTVTTFDSAEQMKTSSKSLKGVKSGVVLQGDTWQVGVDNVRQADEVKYWIGGEVQ